MKLKSNVKNKIIKMNKEELITLINELCECNDDVVGYLNNTLTNTKLDVEKILRQIGKCFEGCNFKVDKAMNLYLTTRKISNNHNALSEIGLLLLQSLIWDFELGNYSQSGYKRIEKVASLVCEDISKSAPNIEYRIAYEELISNDYLYDMMTDIYYNYFSERIED